MLDLLCQAEDENHMKQQWVVVGIVLLFIGACIIPAIAQKAERRPSSKMDGKWWYVGGSGPGNYSIIQDAIDNASTGDTVYVYAGVYSDFFPADYCCVFVSKSIHLIGENKHTTILNGAGRYDVVSAVGGVTISGFTIQNGGVPGTTRYGRGVNLQQVSNVEVSDVILSHNYIAVFIYWGRNIHLTNITFINESGGVSLWDAKNCTITHCVFNHAGVSNNGYPPSGAGSVYIRNNLFTDHSCVSTGYLCIESHGNTTIERNVFQNGEYGILTDTSQGVYVHQNNFINNTHDASISRESTVLTTPFYLKHKQHWVENYWDDWNQIGQYRIRGIWYIGVISPVNPLFGFLLLKLPYWEYDEHPAQEPYDIEV